MSAARPPSSRIAIVPEGAPDWLVRAVTSGGGEPVPAAEAEAVVWIDPADPIFGSSTPPEVLGRLLEECPDVRWVHLPKAGVERFAQAGVLDKRRTWTSAKGVYAKPVAELALALALAGLRNLKPLAWAQNWGNRTGMSLFGGRVTIFGGGAVAHQLLDLLKPFGCEVTVVRRHRQPMEGAQTVRRFSERFEALRNADVVFLALALTEETRGLIGGIELELMAPHAWLVNVARGPHVLTEDLVIALRENAIGGAAMDVTDPEPLPEGHPLWELPNCIVTPHTASTEDMLVPLQSARLRENVRRFGAGEPLIGRVNPELGY